MTFKTIIATNEPKSMGNCKIPMLSGQTSKRNLTVTLAIVSW